MGDDSVSDLKGFRLIPPVNAISILISMFLISLYVALPVSLTIIKPEILLKLTGKPKFTKLTPTKSSGSAVIFDVAEIQIYCGVGIIQGDNGCFYIESLIDKNRNVTVNYFLMSNRLGFKYPIIYSVEQNGVEKITARMTYEKLQASNKSAWKNYYILLTLFGSLAFFLFAAEKLQNIFNTKQGKFK